MVDVEALIPLPPQPEGVPWPTESWPTGKAPEGLDDLVDEVFADESRYGTTFAVVVVQGGPRARRALRRRARALGP